LNGHFIEKNFPGSYGRSSCGVGKNEDCKQTVRLAQKAQPSRLIWMGRDQLQIELRQTPQKLTPDERSPQPPVN